MVAFKCDRDSVDLLVYSGVPCPYVSFFLHQSSLFVILDATCNGLFFCRKIELPFFPLRFHRYTRGGFPAIWIVSIFFIFLYVIGIPLFFVVLIRKVRPLLPSPLSVFLSFSLFFFFVLSVGIESHVPIPSCFVKNCVDPT